MATGTVWDSTDVVWDDPVATWDGGGAVPVQPAFQATAFQQDAFQTSPVVLIDITQTTPAFTQEMAALSAKIVTISQDAPGFTQTAEIHTVHGLDITQTAGAFTQAAEIDLSVSVRIGTLRQVFQDDAFDPDAFQAEADLPTVAPAFTQHLAVGVHAAGTVVVGISQTAPGFTQTADVEGSVSVAIFQVAPAFTQAAEITQPPAAIISQTAPAFLQVMVVELKVSATGTISQTAPAFTQTMRIQIVSWNEWEVGIGDEWPVGTGDEWLVRR